MILIDVTGQGALAQMINHFAKYQCSILGVERIPPEETYKYGIVHLASEPFYGSARST